MSKPSRSKAARAADMVPRPSDARGADDAGDGRDPAAARRAGASRKSPAPPPADGRVRVVIEDPSPCVDGGRFAAKATVGERVVVEADVFADGHDELRARVLWRAAGARRWSEAPMEPLGNDRWRGGFEPDAVGRFEYAIEGWIDAFGSWRTALEKRVEAGQDVRLELQVGAEILRQIAAGGPRPKRALAPWIRRLEDASDPAGAAEAALDPELAALAAAHARPEDAARLDPPLPLVVDPPLARFSAWYELFPRSASDDPARHGTLRDVEARLDYVAALGFDVLYLPPIHPIGATHRKGPNNALAAGPDDLGSPWAIGSAEGGHDAVHPALGTLEDVRRLARAARERGIELALDVAFQASPDHPWVRDHPEWFAQLPDGSIRYAENPPKKYQDIHPLDLACADWKGLWRALCDVFLFWIDHDVRVFRVDNPHTKSLAFWEWCIAAVKEREPRALFLAEAFTRPKRMRRLAKAGFTQSYTYFPWRTDKPGLTEYLTELTQTPVRDYLRPSHWVNTPDILHEYLQTGGRAAFAARLVLAATLGASYGVYGPAFELCEARAVRAGSEEYLDSEKYQRRVWDLDDPASLRALVARINRIRREHPALQIDRTLTFHHVENPALLAYSKTDADGADPILVVVNLDPHHAQSGWTWLDLHALGVRNDESFQVHDLLSDARFLWRNEGNYVALDPATCPAHVFRVLRRVHTEADFDYYG